MHAISKNEHDYMMLIKQDPYLLLNPNHQKLQKKSIKKSLFDSKLKFVVLSVARGTFGI